jgi:hypothetical protein
MAASGIEPATIQLVAQCLNQLRHRVRIQSVCNFTGLHFYNVVISLSCSINNYKIVSGSFCNSCIGSKITGHDTQHNEAIV